MVDGAGTLASAKDENEGAVRIKAQGLFCGGALGFRRRMACHGGYFGAYGIPCLEGPVGREDALHSRIRGANRAGAAADEAVGPAGKPILLLDERGDAQALCHKEGGTADIAPCTQDGVGFLGTKEGAYLGKAADDLGGKTEVFGEVFPLKARNRNAGDGIACGRDAFHLHSALGADEVDFSMGVARSNFVCNADRGEDMPPGSTSAENDAHGIRHLPRRLGIESPRHWLDPCRHPSFRRPLARG